MRLPLIVALLGALLAGGEASGQPVTLKFSHFLGSKSDLQVDVIEPWARELEAITNGQVKVEIFNADSPYGKPGEQAAQVKAGTVDIALGNRGAQGDRFPGSSIIELPFLVSEAGHGSVALWRLYTDGLLTEEYKDYKVLALFVHNPGLIHTSEKRVVAPSDVKGLRLRSPTRTVSAALEHLGAVPVFLPVNELIDAVKAARVEGVVTSWANPVRGFNDYMKKHSDLKFYTSVFFIVMNKEKYDGLPADIRAAVDRVSGETWVAKIGPLWTKWEKSVRDGAAGPDHEIIVPDAASMEAWRRALGPVNDRYLADLAGRGVPNARAAYDRLVANLRR